MWSAHRANGEIKTGAYRGCTGKGDAARNLGIVKSVPVAGSVWTVFNLWFTEEKTPLFQRSWGLLSGGALGEENAEGSGSRSSRESNIGRGAEKKKHQREQQLTKVDSKGPVPAASALVKNGVYKRLYPGKGPVKESSPVGTGNRGSNYQRQFQRKLNNQQKKRASPALAEGQWEPCRGLRGLGRDGFPCFCGEKRPPKRRP